MKLQYGARTDVGQTREHNEDNLGIADDQRIAQVGHLFIVCDGIGGYLAGEVASKLAVETILKSYYETPGSDRGQALVETFHKANQVIHEQGRGSMGTTGVAALLYGGAVFIANVGDSRAYLVRNRQLRQLSHDHSFVAEQVRAGLMTDEQARVSNVKNVITRAIGYQAQTQVDLFREPLAVGDMILLCSDGLHGLVEDPELASYALQHEPQEAVDRLVDLANQRGGSDNITAVLVRVDSVDSFPAGPTDPLLASLLETTQTGQHTQPITEQITERLETRPTRPATAPAPAPSAATPATLQPDRDERRLSKSGLIATMLLLALLVAAGVWLAGPRLGLSPAAQPSPTVVPQASPQVGTPVPTAEGVRPANQQGESSSAPTTTPGLRDRVRDRALSPNDPTPTP